MEEVNCGNQGSWPDCMTVQDGGDGSAGKRGAGGWNQSEQKGGDGRQRRRMDVEALRRDVSQGSKAVL